ncbi:MAG TPA: hypothetical protein VF761_15680 [Gemmatimonadaceae bacterium]
MSDHAITARPAGATLLSVAETASLLLAVLSLVILFALESRGFRLGRDAVPSTELPLFLPHLVLAALIVAGLRSMAALLAGVMATLLGLGVALVWLSAAVGADSGSSMLQGITLLALVQLLLARSTRHARRNPGEGSPMNATRLALGAMVAAAGWLGATSGLAHLDAPRRAAQTAAQHAARRSANERAMQEQFFELAACIQRSPASADSQPLFPVSLAELAKRGDCPAAARPAPEGFTFDYSPGAADSAGGRHTFQLAGREEPMTDSSRKYTTDETFAISGWYGRGDRWPGSRSAPLGALAEAGRCVEAARDTATGAYPASVPELVAARSCNLRATPDDSAFVAMDSFHGQYLVRYTPPARVNPASPGGYTLSMGPPRDPAGRSLGGAMLSFFVDTAGAIHMTRRPRAATAADPVLPDCPREAAIGGAPTLYCRAYKPRQRWGRTDELPTIAWSRSGDGTVGSGDTLYVIPQYRGIIAADSLLEARISWSAGGRDSVIRRKNGSIGESFYGATIFRMKHVYPDTGYHEIRFRVRTGAGEEYELRDSVRVLVRWRRR